MFFGGSNVGHYGSDPAEIAYNKALKEAEKKRDESMASAEAILRQIEELKNKSHIGGFKAPDSLNVSNPIYNNTKREKTRPKTPLQKWNLRQPDA